MPDWQTFQGNPGHTGYVPARFDASRFVEAWEFSRGPGGGVGDLNAINAVVTEAGRVFVTDDASQPAYLYSLDESDGRLVWSVAFGRVVALDPPAVLNGIVYVTTADDATTVLHAFRASDGAPIFSNSFRTQGNTYWLAPVVSGSRVFTAAGESGAGVYAYDANAGARLWARSSGDHDMTAPALDDRYAYYYSGVNLEVYALSDGSPVGSILDPYNPLQSESYYSAPILASSDSIIAFSGDSSRIRVGASAEPGNSRRLINFSLQDHTSRAGAACQGI